MWEERKSSHLYSTASIYEALKVAREILKYFEQRSKYYVCEKVGISERTFRYWRDEILLKAQQWAEEYRLIGE